MGNLFKAQPQSTTTTSNPSPEQEKLLTMLMPIWEKYLKNPAKMPGFSQVADFNPTQRAAQEGLLGSILPQQQIATAAGDASKFMLSPDILDPGSNKYLSRYMEAAQRPLYQNLQESILPGVRGEAIMSGQFGGSRQGIAEGVASGRTQQAASDVGAKIASEGYGQGLDAMRTALGLAPQTTALQAAPEMTRAAVGDQRYALQQAKLSEKAQRYMYEQLAPFLTANQIAAIMQGLPGGSTTATGTAPQSSPLSSILGLGSMFASMFGGPPGMMLGAGLSAAAGAPGLSGAAGLF